MRRPRLTPLLAGVAAGLLIAGCSDTTAPRGETPVPLTVSANFADASVTTLAIRVTATDIPRALVFNLQVVDGRAEGTLNVPPGEARTFEALAFDRAGEITHEGSATVDVYRGPNPPLIISMMPRGGQVPVIVVVGEVLVTVAPSSATLVPDETIQLSATVTDAQGRTLDGAEITWASANPAIAEVDGTGLVTAVAQGQAEIVAIFGIAVGTAVVTVGDAPDGVAFVTTWNTNHGDGATVTLGLAGTVNATIDWGDGTVETVDGPGPHTHDYGVDGTYTVSVTGTFAAYSGGSHGGSLSERAKLVSVDSWGMPGLTSLRNAFDGATNLVSVPGDLAGIQGVTDLSGMFWNAASFNGDIGGWTTSVVTDMSHMFSGAVAFNRDISGWNTANVTDMAGMFADAVSFNQDLSGWCVSLISDPPVGFDDNTPAWTLPDSRPIWGTCGTTPDAPFVVQAISGGGSHTCALTASGVAYCWGANSSGQIGDETIADKWTPSKVKGSLLFQEIAAGGWHTCALTSAGVTYCWGSNTHLQLGDGTTVRRTVPVLVQDAPAFDQIVAGSNHTCGLTSSGVAYCWGNGWAGQLGNDTTLNSSVPVAVAGGQAFQQISAGSSHTCGLTPSNETWCWGSNSSGQLGDGGIQNSSIPVKVIGPHTFRRISAGGNTSCGLTMDDGYAYCWGSSYQREPTPVGGGLKFQDVFSGGSHHCALDAAGAAHCWGAGSFGQLGDGLYHWAGQLSPVAVAGGFLFQKIGLGSTHSCGVAAAGEAYCWGDNGQGRLGDGTDVRRLEPVQVVEPSP